ncbi:MAG: capsid protein [Mesorhizobium sp.]|uniref:Capsid protein n=1 Tax=Mesorhizobium mediterraneum TaxID=43617 RepID=A0AB36R6E3_9HYPH|nr:capsid protein [Mesorhizobium mediterraneum]RWN37932.1 MAG: capsid protein [Mesorhizobium sp.]RWQ39817.1 MAG: capsid protein [Mesorhizobium sp.]TIL24106.1 MAG: capsid protein [Mesorhizobium sp.]
MVQAMARMGTWCAFGVAVTPSPRTLRAELLRLCARIGYSPPALL